MLSRMAVTLVQLYRSNITSKKNRVPGAAGIHLVSLTVSSSAAMLTMILSNSVIMNSPRYAFRITHVGGFIPFDITPDSTSMTPPLRL